MLHLTTDRYMELPLLLLASTAAWPQQPHSFPSACSAGQLALRPVRVLSGAWDFAWLPSYNVSAETDISAIAFNETEVVPGAWDAAWGGGFLDPETFTRIVYADLARE